MDSEWQRTGFAFAPSNFMGDSMALKQILMYIFFTGLVIVSFQNCGQPGSLGLESNDGLAKINDISDTIVDPDADNGEVDDDTDDMQPPSNIGDVKDGPNTQPDIGDRGDTDIDTIVDSDEDGNTIGKIVSCAELASIDTSTIVKSSEVNTRKTRGDLKIENAESASCVNHRGALVLNNIKSVTNVTNIRSLLLKINAAEVGSVVNIRAMSLIAASSVDELQNYRGLACVAASISSVTNYRGILEVKGNIKTVNNFRGVLKVTGDIDELINFRGALEVSGVIKYQENVKTK